MNQPVINSLLFGIYPYICLAIWLLGSLIRFDREQYTWKSDSSQLLRRRQLRLGSNLFHIGVLIVIAGHFAGFLAPHWMVSPFLNASQHQFIAMAAGEARASSQSSAFRFCCIDDCRTREFASIVHMRISWSSSFCGYSSRSDCPPSRFHWPIWTASCSKR